MSFTFELDHKNYIKKRESQQIEFKENFHFTDILKYIKTLVGMANNRGGEIIFGIKDKPHIPIGMNNERFNEIDPKIIDSKIREYFSSEILWSSEVLTFDDKEFGKLEVKEKNNKPILCKKSSDKILREGAVYYRYSGESKEIEYSELSNILKEEREKEKILWMQHVMKISAIGIDNIAIMDLGSGQINTNGGNIIIDKGLIDKIKFIKEGEFVEKEGAPALKLVGEINGFIDAESSVNSDKIYPLFTKEIMKTLNITQPDFTCLSFKLEIKGNRKFHTALKAGNNSGEIHKYSNEIIDFLKPYIEDKDYLETCRKEYRITHPIKKKKSNTNK